MAEDFNEYDEGFRLGTFDKCNGRDFPRVEEDGSIFAGGYYDAWASNENQISVEDEDTRRYRLSEEAYQAGRELALRLQPQIVEAGTPYADFSDSFYDGFTDNC